MLPLAPVLYHRPIRSRANIRRENDVPELFPRPPRHMKQPTKDQLRTQLAEAAAELERRGVLIEQLRTPWWRRLLLRLRGEPPA